MTLIDKAPTLIEAQLALGQMYLDRQEYPQAFDVFRSAARSHDGAALNMLGRCHERGWGTPINYHVAARYFSAAAERGDAWGLFNLADAYFRGHGVDQDLDQAFALYSRAAELGLTKALNMIASFYEDGLVVEQSLSEARKLYHAGAIGGDCWAQFNLARLLLQEEQIDTAISWFNRSLQHGFYDFYQSVAALLIDHPLSAIQAIGHQALRRANNVHSSDEPET